MHNAPLAIDKTINLRRIPSPAQLVATRFVRDKSIEVVAQHRKIAAIADNHMRVEIFAPHDMRILIQLQEMRDHGLSANKDTLDDGVEIAHIVVVVVEIAVAVSSAPALVER